MEFKKILQVTLCLAILMVLFFLLDSARKWAPGIKRIGEFTNEGVPTQVYDVKSGNRACLVFVSRFKENPNPQFFFSCPQER